jgi:hypothetical protein
MEILRQNHLCTIVLQHDIDFIIDHLYKGKLIFYLVYYDISVY